MSPPFPPPPGQPEPVAASIEGLRHTLALDSAVEIARGLGAMLAAVNPEAGGWLITPRGDVVSIAPSVAERAVEAARLRTDERALADEVEAHLRSLS